jgi:heat-inducible transcriptional repressor
MSDINHRARQILHAIVQEYISTGDAVGSRTVTKRYGIDLSPTTVRNVMSDLEDLGLLKQPHTSAGRVPTERGMRYFVDSLLRVRGLSPREREEISARLSGPVESQALDVDDVIRDTVRGLSDLSHYAALVLSPKPDANLFEHIEFIPLRDGEILVVLVTKSGAIENKIVRLEAPIEPAELDRMGNYLNELLSGLTLEAVRGRVLAELADEKSSYDQLAAQALALGAAALSGPSEPNMIIEGKANLLESVIDVDRMRALLRTLEEKSKLIKLLDRTIDASGIQVFIGAELAVAGLEEMSIVAVPYGPEERPLGMLGVIGPQRMNYSKVIPLVDFTAQHLSGVLNRR